MLYLGDASHQPTNIFGFRAAKSCRIQSGQLAVERLITKSRHDSLGVRSAIHYSIHEHMHVNTLDNCLKQLLRDALLPTHIFAVWRELSNVHFAQQVFPEI